MEAVGLPIEAGRSPKGKRPLGDKFLEPAARERWCQAPRRRGWCENHDCVPQIILVV